MWQTQWHVGSEGIALLRLNRIELRTVVLGHGRMKKDGTTLQDTPFMEYKRAPLTGIPENSQHSSTTVLFLRAKITQRLVG